MILNLIGNAIKHTPPAGNVRLSLTRSQERYLVEISDTGPGIPAESQPHIFERFYRADKARSRADTANGGAGLGLAIARWIAEAHKGSLYLARSDRNGSAFVATLPAPARK
jgi:signal transduction histidine kinase